MLESFRTEFARYRRQAELSLERVGDAEFFARLDPGSNSIAVLVKHLGGNLRSRFTDFLTTDGEKPWRNRDGEFEVDGQSRAEILAIWEEGWRALESTLDSLSEDDLRREVTIRAQPLTVADALTRSVAHAAAHVGQITLLAKHLLGERWRSLSIPPGASQAYNAAPSNETRPRE